MRLFIFVIITLTLGTVTHFFTFEPNEQGFSKRFLFCLEQKSHHLPQPKILAKYMKSWTGKRFKIENNFFHLAFFLLKLADFKE